MAIKLISFYLAVAYACYLQTAQALKCYECIHTEVTATDAALDAVLKKSMNFEANDVSCLLGADTFEENVPSTVECTWDVINRQVLLSVRAGELKVETDEVPLEVAYPGNRDNEYEFRCQKQTIDVTWEFDNFDIEVIVNTRGCQAVHIPDAVPNTCTYDMDAWLGERFEEAVVETHSLYQLEGELCFCDGNECNAGMGTFGSMGIIVVALMIIILMT